VGRVEQEEEEERLQQEEARSAGMDTHLASAG